MAGGQLAAVYDGRKGVGIPDATDQIFHILRTHVAEGKVIPEARWRVIRHQFLRFLTQPLRSAWSPLQQMSHYIQRMAYQNPALLFPLMRTAINSTRELHKQPRGTEVEAYNISSLELIRWMEPVVQEFVKSDKYPETLDHLESYTQLAKFLNRCKMEHSLFIKGYITMHTLWTANEPGEGTTSTASSSSISTATAYLERSSTSGVPLTAISERSFIGAVYGWTVSCWLTYQQVEPNLAEAANASCWDIYTMRHMLETFVNNALGEGSASKLWVDGAPPRTGPLIPRPQNAPWNEDYHKELANAHTPEEQAIITNVNTSLVALHRAAQQLKLTSLSAQKQHEVNNIFQKAEQVCRCLVLRRYILPLLRSSHCTVLYRNLTERSVPTENCRLLH